MLQDVNLLFTKVTYETSSLQPGLHAVLLELYGQGYMCNLWFTSSICNFSLRSPLKCYIFLHQFTACYIFFTAVTSCLLLQ